jgi:hypothetical protein
MWNNQSTEIVGAVSRWLLASVLFLLFMFGWLGDSLLSALIRRPTLSFREVYTSWKTAYFPREDKAINQRNPAAG